MATDAHAGPVARDLAGSAAARPWPIGRWLLIAAVLGLVRPADPGAEPGAAAAGARRAACGRSSRRWRRPRSCGRSG